MPKKPGKARTLSNFNRDFPLLVANVVVLYECIMSILFAICGLVVAVLFGLAGYRVSNEARCRDMLKAFTYQGRIQAFYENVYRSNALSVTTFLKRAAIAHSRPCQARF